MTAGFICNNSSNSVQIDDTYKNLALRYTGTLTCNDDLGSEYDVFGASVTRSCENPVIAFRSVGGGVSFISSQQSGSNWTFTFYGNFNQSFNYYIFDNPQPSSGGVGLEVFDSNGNRTFWSGYKYLRVRDVLSGQSYVSDAGNYTYDSGRQYAAILAKKSGNYERLYFQDGNEFVIEELQNGLFVESITSGIRFFDESIFFRFTPDAPVTISILREYRDYIIIVVDVTDY